MVEKLRFLIISKYFIIEDSVDFQVRESSPGEKHQCINACDKKSHQDSGLNLDEDTKIYT